mmetsp:Transcript_14735/g.58962  ORF Transcript_14735/g.58962 Transcript_14735/m.58962 type:complete len:204 (+) Transcript_14735:772-1383(+)
MQTFVHASSAHASAPSTTTFGRKRFIGSAAESSSAPPLEEMILALRSARDAVEASRTGKPSEKAVCAPRGAYFWSTTRLEDLGMRTSRAPRSASPRYATSHSATASPWSTASTLSSQQRTVRRGAPASTTGTVIGATPGADSSSGAAALAGSDGRTSANLGARRCETKAPRASTTIQSRSWLSPHLASSVAFATETPAHDLTG